jgi:phosphomannomutase
MEYNPESFKAYDIRGLVGKDFDLEFCERLGRAFVIYSKSKTLVLGRDARNSSPEYLAAVAQGVLKQGADVIDIGMVTTPMFYFAVRDYELHDGGIMVTASHNPAAYNGFKLVDGTAMSIGSVNGSLDVRALVERNQFPEVAPGKLTQVDILPAYLAKLSLMVDFSSIKGLTAVVDAGNGVANVVLPELFRRLDVKVIPLYWEPDGSFPNHEANPMKDETLAELKKRVVEEKADLGIAYDGDADRVFFVDERGVTLRSLETLILLARELVKKHPGAPIGADVRSGSVMREEAEKMGSRLVLVQNAPSRAKPILRRENAIIGAELAGHFYFGELGAGESTAYATLLMLKILCQERKPLSEIVAPLRRVFTTDEINFEVTDKQGAVDRILNKLRSSASAISTLDGIRMDFADDSWFSLKPSNTEPMLRLVVEAKTKERQENLIAEVSALIRPS